MKKQRIREEKNEGEKEGEEKEGEKEILNNLVPTANGTSTITGTSVNPNLSGTVTLYDNSVKTDIDGLKEEIKNNVSKEDLKELEDRLLEKVGVLESGIDKLVSAGLEDTKEKRRRSRKHLIVKGCKKHLL